MTIGSVFTLFVVPVFYSLIAAQHQPQAEDGADVGEVMAALPATSTGVA
jgi:multidrug efflux pump